MVTCVLSEVGIAGDCTPNVLLRYRVTRPHSDVSNIDASNSDACTCSVCRVCTVQYNRPSVRTMQRTKYTTHLGHSLLQALQQDRKCANGAIIYLPMFLSYNDISVTIAAPRLFNKQWRIRWLRIRIWRWKSSAEYKDRAALFASICRK